MEVKIRDFFKVICNLIGTFFFTGVPFYVVYKSWSEMDGLLEAAGLAGFTCMVMLIPYLVIRIILFFAEMWVLAVVDAFSPRR